MFKFCKDHGWLIAGWVVLTGLVAAAYFPSLYHVARADQVSFLAEYAGRDNGWRTVLDSLYYNRTREFSPGDAVLFRPLLFAILSVQKLAFGYGFFWWQLAALAAHCFALTALWLLLRRWSGVAAGYRTAAGLVVVLFAFLFASMEAVIWHGITPYVIFAGFILLAMAQLDRVVRSNASDGAALAACAGWLFAAVLTYEAGVWYVLCFTGYALLSLRGTARVRRAGVLLLPVILYALWSIGHWFLAGIHVEPETSHAARQLFSMQTVSNWLMVLKWFVAGGFFLQPHDVLLYSRMMIPPEVLTGLWPMKSWIAARWPGAAALVLIGSAMVAGGVQPRSREQWARILWVVAMIAGYVLIIAAGRANTRADSTGLQCCLYYFYNFWILFAVLIFLFAGAAVERWPVTGGVLAAVVIVFSAGNASGIHAVATVYADASRAGRSLVAEMDKFIAAHGREPGFSFYMSPGQPGNYPVGWLHRKTDFPGKQYSFVEALYPRYFTTRQPKYNLLRKDPYVR
jgi:hypothetical protein